MTRPSVRVIGESVYIDGEPAKRLYAGGARRCFIGKGVIVKLEDSEFRESWGMGQIGKELMVWKLLEDGDRKYFVEPLVWRFGKSVDWVAQPVVFFRKGRRPLSAWKLAERLFNKYGVTDVLDNDGTIWSKNNWCVDLNGEVRIYDYGF